MMRVLVCGGRDYDDFPAMFRALGGYIPSTAVLIHGDARGADRLAARVARAFGWSAIEAYPADWKVHGKAAGAIRNKEMLDARPDRVIAFPGGKGTANMVDQARRANIPILDLRKEAT